MRKLSLSLSSQLFVMTLILLGFGLLMIGSASVAEGARDFGNKWHFVLLQLKWGGVGLILSLIISRFHPLLWQKLSVPILIIGIILLILVVIPGVGTKVLGARRWLVLPGVVIQPSELIKLVEVIYLSSWLTKRRVELKQFGFFVVVLAGLIMLQPDMGTTLVVTGLAISLYYLTGYPLKHLLTIGGIGITAALIFIFSSSYRTNRVKTFFNPEHDPLGSSYHMRQVVIALGSGGVTGLGIGRSRQKYEYLPESTTDSIFAVVGEELGFIGTSILILAFLYYLSLIFKLATHCRHPFTGALVSGVGSWYSVQILLNLSAMVAIIPLTGVPLPLVSYGGSALITMLMGTGLVLGVARYEKV